MRVRSFGLLLLGPLPLGAFAEPQSEELMRAPARERQRLFAAGPATNIFAAIICLLLLGMVATQFTAAVPGVHAQSLVVDAGAEEAGLSPYDSIISLDGHATPTLLEFSNAMEDLEPGDEVELVIQDADDGERVSLAVVMGDKYQHHLDEGWSEEQLESAGIDNGSAFLGVVGLSEATNGIDRLAGPFDPDWQGNLFSRILYSPFHLLTILITPFDYSGVAIHPMEETKLAGDGLLGASVLLFIVNMLFWLIWVNILLGFTNLIPMLPFDGGHMFRDMVHGFLSSLGRLGERLKLWKGMHPLRVDHLALKATSLSSLAVLFMLIITLLMPYLI